MPYAYLNLNEIRGIGMQVGSGVRETAPHQVAAKEGIVGDIADFGGATVAVNGDGGEARRHHMRWTEVQDEVGAEGAKPDLRWCMGMESP